LIWVKSAIECKCYPKVSGGKLGGRAFISQGANSLKCALPQGLDVMMKARAIAAEPTRCSTCLVRHKSVCGALSDKELRELNQIAIMKRVDKGETILSDEDTSAYFANIVSGVVKLIKMLPDGRQQVVGLHFPPDFLGRAYGQVNACFAEAATDVTLCSFPSGPFERVLRGNADLEHRLFETTLNELDKAREWMLLLGRKTASEKLASFLITLASRSSLIGCKQPEFCSGVTFELPLNRSDIADYLGLTIETVSRQFTKLKAENIIELSDKRRCTVLDMVALAERGGQEPPPLD
jgi:CRP/FNR family transcriptional regulator, anaerobic regulatory protein